MGMRTLFKCVAVHRYALAQTVRLGSACLALLVLPAALTACGSVDRLPPVPLSLAPGITPLGIAHARFYARLYENAANSLIWFTTAPRLSAASGFRPGKR